MVAICEACDELERAIIRELSELSAILNSEKSDWARAELTEAVKSRLTSLAKTPPFKFGVCASGCKGPENAEWLYDLSWYEENELCLVRIPLIVESEWAPDGECDGDFQKLIQARAEHRLWLFGAKNKEEADVMFKGCEHVINNFSPSQSGDRYLLGAALWNQRDFYFHHYVKQ